MARGNRSGRRTVRPRVLTSAENAITAKIAQYREILDGPKNRRELRLAIRRLSRIKRGIQSAFLGKTCPPPRW